MNVAKNWALTIMLIALAFAHCSSELLFKEKIIIPVKKTLNNAGHIDAKLINFSEICQKKSSEIGCFLLIVSWRSFPLKFPVKSADFSANLPLKIPRNFAFFSAKYQKPWLIHGGASFRNFTVTIYMYLTCSALSVSSMKICCSFSFTKLMQNCSNPFF